MITTKQLKTAFASVPAYGLANHAVAVLMCDTDYPKKLAAELVAFTADANAWSLAGSAVKSRGLDAEGRVHLHQAIAAWPGDRLPELRVFVDALYPMCSAARDAVTSGLAICQPDRDLGFFAETLAWVDIFDSAWVVAASQTDGPPTQAFASSPRASQFLALMPADQRLQCLLGSGRMARLVIDTLQLSPEDIAERACQYALKHLAHRPATVDCQAIALLLEAALHPRFGEDVCRSLDHTSLWPRMAHLASSAVTAAVTSAVCVGDFGPAGLREAA